MSTPDSFVEYLVETLAPLGDIDARRMFGGVGIFCEGRMFALIADERLYVKQDAENRDAYDAAGLPYFDYEKRGKVVRMGYRAVPEDAIDDGEALRHWAALGVGAAERSGGSRKRST